MDGRVGGLRCADSGRVWVRGKGEGEGREGMVVVYV